ncbi:MAG TPA: nucleotide exchange factor GrpE [Candidatus Competibacter sp.]|nr:nucleotide exchange factor GrpE [Candidatus Competibacteraceae bacterium]HPE72572.1 nucleotide exchange factor GrpE [Candidatus Competibacter sp.]HRW65255.1 nucleotide exchange factor GrpE [Candidatus Competibacter sp.]
MDAARKEQLLERFRTYLDTLPEMEATVEERRHTDLYSLFAELVALKNEVKLESRQVKTTLEEFRAVFETLRTSQSQLSDELDHARGALLEQRRAALKPVLLELLELRDRLEAGLHALQNHRLSPLGRLCRREQALLHAVAQGQDISLRRLDQILNTQQVSALATQGRPLDPHTMRAAELDRRSDLANGIVTEELRKGYTWQGELLRLAEVKVNRQPESVTSTDAPSADDPLH